MQSNTIKSLYNPISQQQDYDSADVHVGINDLLNSSSKKSIDEICDGIIKIAERSQTQYSPYLYIKYCSQQTKYISS